MDLLSCKYSWKGAFQVQKQCLNNSWTSLKQLWKSTENDFFDPKMGKNYHIKSQNLTKNLDFRTHIWTFGAENTTKSGPFKAKNNAQILPEQLQNNFEKVEKTTFLTPKMVKTRVSTLAKKVDFWVHFRDLSSNIALLGLKIFLKSFPRIAKAV